MGAFGEALKGLEKKFKNRDPKKFIPPPGDTKIRQTGLGAPSAEGRVQETMNQPTSQGDEVRKKRMMDALTNIG